MAQQPFNLKNVKQRLTRNLNILVNLMEEAQEFAEPWTFPTQPQEMKAFLITKRIVVKKLLLKIQEKRNEICQFWADCNCSINDIVQESKADIESEFEEYWSERRGEATLHDAETLELSLEKRLIELECQEANMMQELANRESQATLASNWSSQILNQQPPQHSTGVMERRLLGNELKIPNFYGDPSEYDSFWELFEELVHKQPYSKIEKLSILLNCCKGDAARTLQMIPRTGESYDRAVSQLKSQYQDPRRVTMQMIRKLKSMKQCRDDHRSLRNNLNDIQVIIGTLERQGEAIDTTNMRSMVLDTFSKNVQDEMARKEFDSGDTWTMTELLNNLTIAIKRKEHVDSFRENRQEEHTIFHTNVSTPPRIFCTGCGQQHRFQYCNKYSTARQKIRRLRELNACWKCFSTKHCTESCRKFNCMLCDGPHNLILCRKYQNHSYNYSQSFQHNSSAQRQPTQVPFPSRYTTPAVKRSARSRSSTPERQRYRAKSQEPNYKEQSAKPKSSYYRFPRKASRQETNTRARDYSPSTVRSSGQHLHVRFDQSRSPRTMTENLIVNVQFQDNECKPLVAEEMVHTPINSDNVRLMVVPVQVRTPDEETSTVFALLDSASDQSFISNKLTQKMHLPTQKETTVIVNTFGGRAEKRRVKKVVTFLYNEKGEHILVELLTSDKITPPLKLGHMLPQDYSFLQNNISNTDLQWIAQAVNGTVTPDILIGMDYFNEIIKLNEPVIHLPSGLLITPTFFGPMISGAPRSGDGTTGQGNYWERTVHSCLKQRIDIADMWKLSTIGIEEANTDEEINCQIIKNFYSTVQLRDNKIFVCFPWKPNKEQLSDNYSLAVSRLHQLFKMKQRNPKCWEEYCNIIKEQLKKNFIEDVPQGKKSNTAPYYYIPHQAVIKSESATTKTRIVLDASSKVKGELSLNDVIYQGPLILPNLCGVLLRSRIGSKIMIADVEKAFHMIHLQETERDAVRVLWLKDDSQPPSPSNLRILRFCRLPFGINASPFLLGMSIKFGIEHQPNIDQNFQKQLSDNLYVDNVLLTGESPEALMKKYRTSKRVFDNMSMNLRQFITNDEECNRAIPPVDLSTSKSIKILGVPWDNQKDLFHLECKLKYATNPTKRKVLQATHSTFDPLGLLIPLLLRAKIFLQNLWRENYNWDDILPTQLNAEWKTICQQIDSFKMTVPRPIGGNTVGTQYELCTFVDASIRSFAAVTYLRTIEDDVINSALLMARHRLAPINNKSKTLTIPRLELLALLIGVRLTNFIFQELHLPISKIAVFSDSQVTLHWVRSNAKKGVFIDNRCDEIRKIFDSWIEMNVTCQLHYIVSELNPADCATKGLTKEQMNGHIWWTGPPFLTQQNSQWPELLQFSWKTSDNTQFDVEIESDDKDSGVEGQTVLSVKSQPLSYSDREIFSSEYSSINKYKRIISLVSKFIQQSIYNKINSESQSRLKKAMPEIEQFTQGKPLVMPTSLDLLLAERILIKHAQRTIPQSTFNKLHNLQLFTDLDGIVRCRGRVHARHLARGTLEPILLPPNNTITKMIIKEAHQSCGHQGVNGTLANLRMNYWIPKGRQVIKKYMKSCLVCQKWNARPYFYPNSPPLPFTRTEPARPFAHIGIDLAGPFHVHKNDNINKNKWILLSTCMVTRAVHLEIVDNLGTIEFINALRRLVARRGKPTLIMSDNATNFRLGYDIIDALSTSDESPNERVRRYLANEGMRWKFITPLSPWKGGFYERMVGIMKSTFKKFTKRKSLHENEFYTVIPECESMINSRPLTYAGSTIDDSSILRPIDFLIPYANVKFLSFHNEKEVTDDDYCMRISTREGVLRHFKTHLAYLSSLWKSWTEHYLLELRNFHQTRIKQKSFTRRQPRVGEVVLLMENNLPRGEWPLGLVTDLIQDEDGQVRSVNLKTAKSKVTRSINMLIPLEVESQQSDEPMLIDDGRMTTPPPREHSPGQENNKEESTVHADNEATISARGDSRRVRPWLPRRAKANKTYSENFVRARDNETIKKATNAYWQPWILLAMLTSLTTGTIAKELTDNEVQCTKGGVVIQTSQIQDNVHVCANEYCLEIQHPELSMKIQFPAEITLHSYRIVVKTLLGNSTQSLHWDCPASPFCEQISCTFCAPMLTNPECWPRLAIMLGAVILYITLVTIYLSIRVIRKLYQIARWTWSKITTATAFLFSNTRRRQKSTDELPLINVDSINTRWRASTIIRLMTIICISQWALVQSCQETIVLPTTIAQCDSSNSACFNSSTALAKINTMHSEICLSTTYKDRQVHLMKISVQELILRCQKETLYFSRSTQTQVQSRKRCPHMGTCTGLKCAKISTDTLVDELEEANNFTGITYCTESCGGLGCSCGFPSSGCLFYRIYHVPTDDIIHEIFQCSAWYETIKYKIEQLDSDQSKRTFTGEIKPYAERTVGTTKIQVVSLAFKPFPIQFKRFITNNKSTAYLDDNTSFSYACTINPKLNASTTSCSIQDTCKCNPAEESVACYCTQNELTQAYQLAHLLPLPVPNGIIVQGPKQLPKIRTTDFSIELAVHISPRITRLAETVSDFNCNVIPMAFGGCYSCYKGAVATMECKTDLPQSIAQVNCGIRQFVLTCTRDGYRNDVKLFFNKAKVNEQCQARCGTHTTWFQLQGTLNYINGINPFLKYVKLWDNRSQATALDFNLEFPDVSHFLDVCKAFYLYTVTIAVALSAAILITVAYLCTDNGKTFSRKFKPASRTRTLLHLLPPVMAASRIFHIFNRILHFITFFLRIPLLVIRPLLRTLFLNVKH